MSPRELVVKEAESWIGTPFHHAARVKGAGVDCLMLLAEVYERAGVVAPIEPPFYVPDWHLHRDAERYLEGLIRYAREIQALPAGRGFRARNGSGLRGSARRRPW